MQPYIITLGIYTCLQILSTTLHKIRRVHDLRSQLNRTSNINGQSSNINGQSNRNHESQDQNLEIWVPYSFNLYDASHLNLQLPTKVQQ